MILHYHHSIDSGGRRMIREQRGKITGSHCRVVHLKNCALQAFGVYRREICILLSLALSQINGKQNIRRMGISKGITLVPSLKLFRPMEL